jgi:DNA-binding transcriptional LysR family regulator
MFIISMITLLYEEKIVRRDIDISLLRAFAAVSETGGVTSAARVLNLTQAAVSQQIKRLEEFFSLSLFDREQRRLMLTPNGDRLLAYAQRILALNDEVWGVMTSPDFEGEVRFGVPHDIVTPFVPPILKTFNQCWPRVRVSLICQPTMKLLRMLDNREIDLTLTTEREPSGGGDLLMADQLVWVGARGGDAHKRNPLPVSFGDLTCAFRASTVRALSGAERDWRLTCETSDFAPYCATIEADLAVAPMMTSSVPRNLQVLGPEFGLPALPLFYINLRIPSVGAADVAQELARFIRTGFAQRHRTAA